MIARPLRAGVTLVELMVVLVLLGLLAGVVGLTLHTAAPPASLSPAMAAIAAARDSAIRGARPVTITLTSADDVVDHVAWVTAYPDGRVAADPALGIDPMSGAPRAVVVP